MKKTVLEHFQDIKELEVADGPNVTVEDLLPYKCEQVEKSLKALEIIKEKCVDVFRINYYITSNRIIELEEYKRDRKLTDEELELLKEVLE